MMKRILILLLFTALLAGCVTAYTIVKPERQTVGDVISVRPGMKWNKLGYSSYQGHLEVWTLDGPQLNTLVFFTGVPDGEPLFTRRARHPEQQEKPPVFRANMNPLEVQELLEATVARYFQTTLAESRSLRSETIADGKGFRFETRLVGRDEVERVGIFVGTIRNKKLYGAWFQGARLHYFERYRAEIDQMIKSARLVGDAASGNVGKRTDERPADQRGSPMKQQAPVGDAVPQTTSVVQRTETGPAERSSTAATQQAPGDSAFPLGRGQMGKGSYLEH